MAKRIAEEGCLDNLWIYDLLSRIDHENKLLDLTSWCGRMLGARWLSTPERYWVDAPRKEAWLKLLTKLPRGFRREIEQVNNFVLDVAAHIVPNLDTILSNHAYIEWLLYHNLDHEKYREHIVHPVKVAAVAQWLLKKSNREEEIKSNLHEAEQVKCCLAKLNIAEDFFKKDKQGEKVIRAALWIAGLFHDLGYGHNFFCQLERRISDSYRFYSGDVVGGSITGFDQRLLEQSLLLYHLVDETDMKDYSHTGNLVCKESNSPKEGWELRLYKFLSCNHGIAGALNVLYLLQEIVEYWPKVDPKLILTFELAAEAIFLHDLTEQRNYSPPQHSGIPFISFRNSPLAVILVLADEIQDWGRPRFDYCDSLNSDEIIVKQRRSDQRIPYRWEGPDKNGLKTLRLPDKIAKKLRALGEVEGQKRFSSKDFVTIESLSEQDRQRITK